MLISHNFQFVVALPTKCGTQTMRNMAIEWSARGPGCDRELMEEPELRHRMIVPEGAERYARYMVVRHPQDRLISAFNYLLTHKNEWYHEELQDLLVQERSWARVFEWWTWKLMDERDVAVNMVPKGPHGHRPHIWTDSLVDLRHHLSTQGGSEDEPGALVGGHGAMGVGILRLESLASDWRGLLSRVGWITPRGAEAPVPRHFNKASKVNGGEPEASWDDSVDWDWELNPRLVKWLQTDADAFGYTLHA